MPPESIHHIQVRLEQIRERRGISMAELARRVDITEANLYTLRRGDARAIRFPTLSRLCEVLECTPGELLVYDPRSSSVDPTTPDAAATVN
ncbi:helix-turn-helix domain-containing protein [Nocardia carnea]|uniref:helix-turn-helix domain-containing protein n=1 Tax=Nocardia carnea TaxID=37328 RepID=UPI0024540AB5|nr:helix-turn-helix transcriptional regulator [Nocardia carnea]